MHYENILVEKKKELEKNGHTIKIFTTIRDILSFNNSKINFIKDKCGWGGCKSDFLNDQTYFNSQTKYFFFCHHGSSPKGEITLDVINSKLTEKDILKISNVVDIFIETKNLTKFINTMSKYFNINYNSKSKKNTNKHRISFDDNYEQLLSNNKHDCFLLETYKNDENHEFNL